MSAKKKDSRELSEELDELFEAMQEAKKRGVSEEEWNNLLNAIAKAEHSGLSEEEWSKIEKTLQQIGLSEEDIEMIRATLLSRCSSEGG